MNDIKDIIEEIKSRCDIANVISSYININHQGQIIKDYVLSMAKKRHLST